MGYGVIKAILEADLPDSYRWGLLCIASYSDNQGCNARVDAKAFAADTFRSEPSALQLLGQLAAARLIKRQAGERQPFQTPVYDIDAVTLAAQPRRRR